MNKTLLYIKYMSKPETCKKERNNQLQIHLYRTDLYRVTTYDTND